MSTTTSDAKHGHGHDDGHGGHGDHAEGAVHAHISDWKFLVAIFMALIFLTFVTVAVSYVNLGPLNTIVAILVATMKAALVATFFMHLAHDKAFNAIALVASFIFLVVFFLYSYDDLNTRGRVDDAHGTRSYNGVTAGGGMPEPEPAPAAAAGGGHGAAAPAAGGAHGAAPAAPAAGGHGGGH